MTEQNHIAVTQAILVGLCLPEGDPEETEKSLDELERLLETAGGSCFAKVVQNKDHPDPRTCVGSGKVAEIRDLCARCGIDLVIFDTELSPAQIRNLEDGIGDEVRVIDRSMLILDIFALHAVTGEGKLQVELAQLKYTAPRLIGKGAELSRLGGGIGTRGPGETKLESDRRHMKRRIAALEAELEALERSRRTIRAARDRSGLSKVAIVGYTNAGKSTLLNRLTDAGILAEDKLFATLDPTTRKLELPDGTDVLLTDTVGFIRKLPHHLVHAFRSTWKRRYRRTFWRWLWTRPTPNTARSWRRPRRFSKSLARRASRRFMCSTSATRVLPRVSVRSEPMRKTAARSAFPPRRGRELI